MGESGWGRRLKAARELVDLTQKEVARALAEAGVIREARHQTVSELEKEARVPNLTELRFLCRLYGVRADWVLWGELPMKAAAADLGPAAQAARIKELAEELERRLGR